MHALSLTGRVVLMAAAGVLLTLATARAQNVSEASPAARPIPPTETPQEYASELIDTGRARFGANCGFCHGADASGGAGGSDLTRSELVAADVRGDRIGALVRSGRVDAGMPAFTSIAEPDLAAIVAFIHAQKALAESATGGRRSVEVTDLATGNARAGRRYFDANCVRCHSATGDLAGVAARLEGLPLLRRMLYPGGPTAKKPSVRLTTAEGETVTGEVAYRDEFTIAVSEPGGRYRSWATSLVTFEIDDPLAAHVAELARYTDESMHDVLAYLHTLR